MPPAIQGTVAGLDGQVALADVLGLEAVRIFLPDVFRLLPAGAEALTATSTSQENARHNRNQSKERLGISTEPRLRLRAQVDKLIKGTDTQDAVVRAMLVRLFAASRRYMAEDDPGQQNYNDSLYGDEWATRQLRERRVAHEHILRVYLERVAGDDLLAFYDAERALERMTDGTALDRFLRSRSPARWVGVLDHLWKSKDLFHTAHVEPGTTVLLNLLPRMPKQSRGSLRDESQVFVGLVIVSLLRTLESPDAAEAVVRCILSKVTSLSSMRRLVHSIGYSGQDAHQIVSKTAAAAFERQLREDIRSASVYDLTTERDLLRVLAFAKSDTDPSADPFDIPDSPELTFVLLRSYGVQNLRSLYGDEAPLRARFKRLNAQFEELKSWIESRGMTLDEAEHVLKLATDYLNE